MMNPSTSVLALIDAPAQELCDTAPALKNLKMLDDAAVILRVPVFMVRYPDSLDAGVIGFLVFPLGKLRQKLQQCLFRRCRWLARQHEQTQ